jgi:hypothetical protein
MFSEGRLLRGSEKPSSRAGSRARTARRPSHTLYWHAGDDSGRQDQRTWRSLRRSGRLLFLLAVLATFLPACAVLYREADTAYTDLVATLATDDVKIELRRPFIRSLRNRVTIEVSLLVTQAEPKAFPPFADGDLHFAGESERVQLPVVGEIINAASEERAMRYVHAAERSGKPLSIWGVWRIWPEHAGSASERQGEDDSAPESTDPDHVFEIHPVTRAAGLPLLDSFHPVDGFAPEQASQVVPTFEAVHCQITVKRHTVVIATQKGLFNDLEFIMEVTGRRQRVVQGGRFVTASILDEDGRVLARNRRMVFVKGTAPERAVRPSGPAVACTCTGSPGWIWRRSGAACGEAVTIPAFCARTSPMR